MKILMTANDLGLHPAVARACEDVKSENLVKNWAVVGNGQYLDGINLDGVSVGIHLDILRGRPLMHWQKVKTLVDNKGAFLVDPVQLFQLYANGKLDHEQVEWEWSAQIERVLDMGVKPAFLSSHKGVHAWPSFMRLLGMLAQRYGIQWVRKPDECSEVAKLDKTPFKSKFTKVCSFFDRDINGVSCPDGQWERCSLHEEFTPDALMTYINRNPLNKESVVEILCTPGLSIAGDPILEDYLSPTTQAGWWLKDFQALKEKRWKNVFDEQSFQLTSYDELSTEG